jgi:hypothetical protein
VPVATLAEALPYVNWITLAALAAGSFVFAVVTGQLTDATTGYLRFTVITAGVLALLAFASDSALPEPTVLAIQPSTSELDSLRRLGLLACAATSLAYAIVIGSRAARRVIAVVGIGGLSITMLAAAFGWAPTSVDAVAFSVQLGSLSLVTGGSVAAVALGHWYLVTPKLSIDPLGLQTRMLLAALIVQGLLFVVWTTLGGGIDQGAWDAFSGPSALLVVLRGLITIAFPLVLAYMAYRTAQTRSMESATGLLYINLAAVLAGTIGAAALYVSQGLLV